MGVGGKSRVYSDDERGICEYYVYRKWYGRELMSDGRENNQVYIMINECYIDIV